MDERREKVTERQKNGWMEGSTDTSRQTDGPPDGHIGDIWTAKERGLWTDE